MELIIEYNECKNCKANDGRAGILISTDNFQYFCMNCKDTKESGNLVIHPNLTRTEEELQRTAKLLEVDSDQYLIDATGNKKVNVLFELESQERIEKELERWNQPENNNENKDDDLNNYENSNLVWWN